jgi:hypothetical protein
MRRTLRKTTALAFRRAVRHDRSMLVDVTSGSVLCAGGIGAAIAAARTPGRRLPRALLAVALALAAAGAFADSDGLTIAGAGVAIAALAVLVLEHRPDVGLLSWLDAGMGASAAAAVAVALGAEAPIWRGGPVAADPVR